ncbi:Hypothetical protein FKW44_016028, partial [Caligus rogercresseyi]
VFWGYKSLANGPLDFAKPNRDVLGLQIPHQWALAFSRTQSLFFRVTSSLPMGARIPPNTIELFLGYKSSANGPSGSAKHNRGVLGLQLPRQWVLGFCQTQVRQIWGANPLSVSPHEPAGSVGHY